MDLQTEWIGKRFGQLTVRNALRRGCGVSCVCACDCGNTVRVASSDLLSGKIISCGCVRRKRGVEQLHYIDGTCLEMLRSNTLRRNNRSGCPGVFFDRATGKWRAEIMLQGKRRALGRFPDCQSAIDAREEARQELHVRFLEEHTPDRETV